MVRNFAVFVGDTKFGPVKKMLELLSNAGYTTQALNGGQLPNNFIPVVLDERQTDNTFVFRSTWAKSYPRPDWCKNQGNKVLLFKAKAVDCCPKEVLKAVLIMVTNY